MSLFFISLQDWTIWTSKWGLMITTNKWKSTIRSVKVRHAWSPMTRTLLNVYPGSSTVSLLTFHFLWASLLSFLSAKLGPNTGVFYLFIEDFNKCIWCLTSRWGKPFRRRLLFACLPEPWWKWSRLHLRRKDQHSGYHRHVQRRQVQEPCGKAKGFHTTGTCKQTQRTVVLKDALKVNVAVSVTRHAVEISTTIQWRPATRWTASWRPTRWW